MADRVNISLDETAQALWNKLENDIKNTYENGGRSEFFRDMLMKYADDKTRLEVKKELIEGRIESLEERIEELKLQKQGIDKQIEEIQVDEPESTDDKVMSADDEEFWDSTVEMIMTQRSRDEPRTVEARFNKWFDGRHTLYKKKHGSLPQKRFKQKLLEESENRGYEEEVEKLK